MLRADLGRRGSMAGARASLLDRGRVEVILTEGRAPHARPPVTNKLHCEADSEWSTQKPLDPIRWCASTQRAGSAGFPQFRTHSRARKALIRFARFALATSGQRYRHRDDWLYQAGANPGWTSQSVHIASLRNAEISS